MLLLLTILLTDTLLIILTLFSGTSILPVPFARNSKSAFEVVVVIKLSSINISSNCAAPVTSKTSVNVRLVSV